MEKRGQVTVFIILGIVIIILVGILIYLSGILVDFDIEVIPPQVLLIYEFTNDCLKETGEQRSIFSNCRITFDSDNNYNSYNKRKEKI